MSTTNDSIAALSDLAKAARTAGQGTAGEKGKIRGLPPVHLWNPDFCGDLDMRIASDGLWHYCGTPIGREALVRLFSTVLRKDDDRYFLVTPVEKIGITVEDVPFVAVAMDVAGQGEARTIRFTTNVGDEMTAGPDNRMWFTPGGEEGEVTPYCLVRARLEARISRSVFYDLVDLGVDHVIEGVEWFGVWSSGVFFPIVETRLIAHLR